MGSEYDLKNYLNCVSKTAPMTGDVLELALLQWRAGDEQVRQAIEESYLGAVVAWVMPYRSNKHPFARLIEAGNQGLFKTFKRLGPVTAVELPGALRQGVKAEVEAYLVARTAR